MAKIKIKMQNWNDLEIRRLILDSWINPRVAEKWNCLLPSTMTDDGFPLHDIASGATGTRSKDSYNLTMAALSRVVLTLISSSPLSLVSYASPRHCMVAWLIRTFSPGQKQRDITYLKGQSRPPWLKPAWRGKHLRMSETVLSLEWLRLAKYR